MKLNLRAALAWPWVKKHWFISGLAVLIGTCAFMLRDRTVEWEEEVLLNTGEAIWVKRTVKYVLQGAGGNPLDVAYRPSWDEQIDFQWKGASYVYKGDASLMVLAISPLSGEPVLVAKASSKDWHWQHHYRCTAPFYVQLTLDRVTKEWIWPTSIESWLYRIPRNLMSHRGSMGEMRRRYSAAERADIDKSALAQSTSNALIDPNYKFDQCKK